MIIDLRSDAVSRPSEEMMQAMMAACVGDDVFGDDPSVIELQDYAAKLFGKEAGLFCPSGIMCNQAAIKVHTPAGKKFVCNEFSHVYYFENGGPAYLAGASPLLIAHENGIMRSDDIDAALSENDDIAMVTLESTVNKGGGCYYDLEEIAKIHSVCKKHNVILHLDGARIFNALAETGDSPQQAGKYFDTLSFCLSKGLGAPAGSVIVSDKETISKARAARNKFGGGMRQAGYLAAAGLFALKNNISRLKEDHFRAKRIKEELKKPSYVSSVLPVDTNIVIFKLNDDLDENDFLKKLSSRNIKAVPFGRQTIRFVTHLDFTDAMLEKLTEELKNLA